MIQIFSNVTLEINNGILIIDVKENKNNQNIIIIISERTY